MSRLAAQAAARVAQGCAQEVSFGDAVKVWTRIALLSFGGPAGQIAVMHRVLVEEERWIGEERFLHALSYCMLLPGPEAQQLAIYIGWLMHKAKGGLVAGGLFVLPGFVAIMGLSFLYVLLGKLSLVTGLFFGLKAAVLAIVVQALIRIAGRSLHSVAMLIVAVAAFAAMLASAPFPLVVFGAGLFGWIANAAAAAPSLHPAGRASSKPTVLGDTIPPHATDHRRSLVTAAILLAAWLLPVTVILNTTDPENVFGRIATFFSAMAVVTFGGAYAVLAYVAQQAVGHYHWLSPTEMLDGLGLAETTPGPLIMVTQFVGFLAGYRQATGMSPLLGATLAAMLTTWVTFVPCFVWIFAGAPFMERLRGNRRVTAALGAISAAIVGVIANLATWFAVHFIFGDVAPHRFAGWTIELPDHSSIRLAALAMTAACMVWALALRASTVRLLVASSMAGAILQSLGAIP